MAGAMRPVENEALIESSFRRLLAAIESEREKIRSMWQEIEQTRDSTSKELERLKTETEEWCFREKRKIDQERKQLCELREKMSVLWPSSSEVLHINCSNEIFSLPKSTLCGVEGSYLNHMFSDEFKGNIPRDSEGRYLLDFNPRCFRIIVEYLQNRRLKPNAPLPAVPPEEQQNMDILAETLKLKPFLPDNKVSPVHGTSLQVQGNIVQATHQGWQCLAAQWPLAMSGESYFEVKILSNPDPRGGLAVGVAGRPPKDMEVHSIRLPNSILYNSNNGLIGDSYGAEDVTKGIQLIQGSTIGVKCDPNARTLQWYYNRQSVGTSAMRVDKLEALRTVYPVFALFIPEQKISVDFTAPCPHS